MTNLYSEASRLSLSRRDAMALGGAALVTAMAGPAFAASPKRGGHARIGVRGGSISDTLDPQTFGDVFMRTVGYGFFNTLTGIAGDGTLSPDLAES